MYIYKTGYIITSNLFYFKYFFFHFYKLLTKNFHSQGLPSPRARENKRCMLTNAELGKMLEICRENGGVNGDILRAVERIANGYLSAETSCKTCDKAIVVNNALVKFCAIWRRIDARKNIFAYITSLVRNELRMHNRSSRLKRRIFNDEIDISKSGYAAFQPTPRDFRAECRVG